MDPKPHSSFLPLHVDEALEPFHVEGSMAVRALVRELIGARALIALYAEEQPDVFIVTRILALEADSIEIDFTGDDDRLHALLQAPYMTVVGAPGPVKIQFRLADAEFTPSKAPWGAAGTGGGLLTAPLPSSGWRVQRRNAFRVQPPLSDQATIVVRTAPGAEIRGRLTDLSVGGLGALWESTAAEPELGSMLRHCRIEASDVAPIPCDLRVVRIDKPADGGASRLSCEFHAMPQSVARFVQLYVMDIEKRARLASPKG